MSYGAVCDTDMQTDGHGDVSKNVIHVCQKSKSNEWNTNIPKTAFDMPYIDLRG